MCKVIALQQPVARDLRDLTANLKLITDLERIADHATDICEHVLVLLELNQPKTIVPAEVIKLSERTKKMLRGALDAYVSRDAEKARKVIKMDDKIDSLHKKLNNYLIRQMTLDPANVEGYAEMLLICTHFERSADHAQNVAEWVVYYIEGRYAHLSDEKKAWKRAAAETDPSK